MLNREQLQELAHFKLLVRKYTGVSIRIDALIHQPEYQQQMFDLAEEQEDEELLLLSLMLRDRLGLLDELAEPERLPLPNTSGSVLSTDSASDFSSQAVQEESRRLIPRSRSTSKPPEERYIMSLR